MANTKNVGVNLTKEEMKEAFNQFIDLMYEAKGNSNVKVPQRLVKTMPMIREEQLQAEEEAKLSTRKKRVAKKAKPTNVLETKRTHINRNDELGYIIDLAKLTEIYNQFVSRDNYDGLKRNNPTKEIEIMDKAFNFNEERLVGEGRVTEGQVWALERVGEFLGIEPYSYLIDEKQAA